MDSGKDEFTEKRCNDAQEVREKDAKDGEEERAKDGQKTQKDYQGKQWLW